MATYAEFSKDRKKIAAMNGAELLETRENLLELYNRTNNLAKKRSVEKLLAWCDEEIGSRSHGGK